MDSITRLAPWPGVESLLGCLVQIHQSFSARLRRCVPERHFFISDAARLLAVSVTSRKKQPNESLVHDWLCRYRTIHTDACVADDIGYKPADTSSDRRAKFFCNKVADVSDAGTDWLLLSVVMTVPVDSPSAVAQLTGSADISPAKHFSRNPRYSAQDSLAASLIDLPVSGRSSGHCQFKADRPTKLTWDEIKVLLSNFLQLHVRSSLLPKGKLQEETCAVSRCQQPHEDWRC